MLKMLLGIECNDDSKNNIMQYILNNVKDMVKNYCRIETIPVELRNIMLHMAVDVYRTELFGQEELTGTVKSISEGDVSVVFNSSGSGEYPSATLLNSYGGMTFLKNYAMQLDKFRKIGW